MTPPFNYGAQRRAEIFARLKELADEPDSEKAHIEADDLLCEYLLIVGAVDIVETYRSITKYHA